MQATPATEFCLVRYYLIILLAYIILHPIRVTWETRMNSRPQLSQDVNVSR